MNLLSLATSVTTAGGADFVLDAALKSLALLLVAIVATRLLRRRSAATLHAIWTIALAACLAMPLVSLVTPAWTLAILPSTRLADSTPEEQVGRHNAVAHINASNSPATAPIAAFPFDRSNNLPTHSPDQRDRLKSGVKQSPATGQSKTATVATATTQFSWRSFITTFWLTGVAVCLLRSAWLALSLAHVLRRSRPIDAPSWRAALAEAAQSLSLRRRVQIRQLDEASTPMVAGVARPLVVLPHDASDWSPAQRHFVLLHELAHVERQDVLTQTLAGLACALNWFNPLAWFGLAQMRKLRELACDDMVLAADQRAADYAGVLLDVARTYRYRRLAAAVGMARNTNVENRITAILDKARARVPLSPRAMKLLAASATVFTLILGSIRLQSNAEEPTTTPASKEFDSTKETEEKTPTADSDARTTEVRITDEAGKPLAGANLHVSIWEMDGNRRNYPNRDYTADENGVVTVNRPARLKIMRMWPDKSGYVPEFVNFAEGSHEDGKLIPDRYEFKLELGAKLSGTIVDDAGQPIPGVMVEVSVDVDEPAWGVNPKPMISHWLTDDDFGDGAIITDKDGRWSIHNAPHAPVKGKDVQFRLKHTHKDFISDFNWSESQNEQGITSAMLRDGSAKVVLSRGVIVTGGVFDADWKPVTNGLAIWHDDPYLAEGVNEAPIDDTGRFKTPPLPPGKRWITVLAPGYSPERQEVTIAKRRNKVQFSLKPGKRLTFNVVDNDGKPIPKAYVSVGEWRGVKSIYNHKHSNVPESQIPRHADDDGIYTWGWAPEDAVTYDVGAKDYGSQQVTLTAIGAEHVVTLYPNLVSIGNVTDATTGKPIPSFAVTPVIVYRPGFLQASFDNAKSGVDGQYKLPLQGGGDPDYRYQVRVEADGYRSVLSEKSYGQQDGRVTQDFVLQPAPARRGVVLDSDGQPVLGAAVVEATASIFPSLHEGKLRWGGRQVETAADGKFQLRATAEPYRLRVMHDAGYAEIGRTPDEPIGTIRLAPWASVSGQLLQDGKPVPKQAIYFYTTVEPELGKPRYQGYYYQITDADGRFQFDRLPPVVGSIRTDLGPWEDSPLTSGPSVPLDLQPGEQRMVTLGGDGAAIIGNVIATGRDEAPLDKHWSINYLISRDRGVDLPADFPTLSFDPRQPVEAAWFLDPNHSRWLATRANYFVKLTPDGDLRINGVPPGTYDLVLRLYEQPAGCLVETVGEKVVTIEVAEEDVAAGPKDIGQIEVECRAGPRVGENMGIYAFTDSSGRVQTIADMQGRYVLMHVWASWCAPCLESLPDVKSTAEQLNAKPITFVGLNVDKDAESAKALSKKHDWTWSQNYLGESSDMARQLAISSVPTYYLIGPDGLLVASATEWTEIKSKLETVLAGRSGTP